jgi:DNA mismatch repair protein MutS
VKPGAADRSYGIQVATLAGLPKPVTARAGEVLRLLENGQVKGGAAALEELPLFAAAAPLVAVAPATDVLAHAVKALNPDELTPKSALEALYKLKALVDNDPA